MTSTMNRTLKRETPAKYQGRNLVVELWSYEIWIRPKGKRFAYRVSYEQIYKLGAENEARRRREERQKGKA